MKAIYNNSQNSLIAFKGEYEPIQFYKGGQLIDNISAVPLSIEGNPSIFTTEYNKSLINLDLKGNTEQAGTPTPTSPQPINSSSNIELMLSGGNLLNQDLFLENTDVEKVGTAYSFKSHPTTYYKGSNREKLLNQIKSILKPNVKYTIASRLLSRQGGGTNNQGRLQFNDKIGGGAEIFALPNYSLNRTVLKTASFTQEQIDNILSVWIFGSNPSISNVPTIGNIIIINGEYTKDTLPPFDESYIEPTTVPIPIELNKLGDVADELIVDYSAKTVKLIKRIEKFYLKDQIESVKIDTSWEFGNVALVTTQRAWKNDENGLCSHCKRFNGDTSILSFDCSNNDIQFYIVNQSSPADFIQWATENNVEMALVRYSPEVIDYSSEDWAQDLLELSPKRNQTNVITITSDLPISEQNIKYAKWGGNIEN